MAGLNNSGGGGAQAIRAGRAFVEMSLNDNAVWRSLDRFKARFAGLGSVLTKAGGGLAAAGGAVLAPLAALFSGATDRATQLDKLATKLGVPVDRLNEFAYAAEQTGITLEELEGHFENFAERVFQGAQGTGEAANSFKMLNLDAGKLKLENPIDQLLTLSDAMESVTNETERLGLLSSFGGDQFQKLNALFRGGSGNIRTAMGRAPVVNAEDVAKVREFNRAWLDAKLSVQAALLPLIRYISPLASSLAVFAKENAGVARTLAIVAAGALVGGTALAALGLGMSGLAAAASLVVSPLGLAATGLALFLTRTESGKGVLLDFGETAETVFAGLSDALQGGDFATAFEIAMTGLQLTYAKFVAAMTAAWNQFKGVFVDGWHAAVASVALLLNDFRAGVTDIFLSIAGVITPALATAAEGALAIIEKVLRAADALDPTDSLKDAIDRISGLRVEAGGIAAGASGTADAERASVEKERAAIEKELMQAHSAEQKAREDARAAEANAARDEIARLQKQLDDLRGRAAVGAGRPALGGALAASFPTASQVADTTRGAFDTSFASRRFGGRSLEKDIADNTKDTAKGVDQAVDELRGISSALRFR